NDDLQLVVNRIQDAQPLLANLPTAELFIRMDAKDTAMRTDLLKKLQAAHGTTPVITVDTATRESILLDKRYWVKAQTGTDRCVKDTVWREQCCVKKTAGNLEKIVKCSHFQGLCFRKVVNSMSICGRTYRKRICMR
ncbi:DNA polymerase III DnaE, partial [Lacticaseibacillus rhamnosus MTCC 5462]